MQRCKIQFKLHKYTFCDIEKKIVKNNIIYIIILYSIFNEMTDKCCCNSVGDTIDELRNYNDKLYYLLKKK